MTEPLWVDPTPVVRWVMSWCRVAQQTVGPFSEQAHRNCPGHAERPGHADVCICPCHRPSTPRPQPRLADTDATAQHRPDPRGTP